MHVLFLACFSLLKKETVTVIALETEFAKKLFLKSHLNNNTMDARTYASEATLPTLSLK